MKVNNAYCYINIELNRWPGDGKEEKKRVFFAGGKFTRSYNDRLDKTVSCRRGISYLKELIVFLRGTDRCSMFSRTSLRGEYQGFSENAVTKQERKTATFREKVFLKKKKEARWADERV